MSTLVGSRVGWKVMEEANTLAYCDRVTITAVNIFIVQATGAYVIKLFTAILQIFMLN